jgi:hypothetical protein
MRPQWPAVPECEVRRDAGGPGIETVTEYSIIGSSDNQLIDSCQKLHHMLSYIVYVITALSILSPKVMVTIRGCDCWVIPILLISNMWRLVYLCRVH